MDLVEILEPFGPVLGHELETAELGGDRVVYDVADTPHSLVVGFREIPADFLRPERHVLTRRVDEGVRQVCTRQLRQNARLAVVNHVLPGRGPVVEDVSISYTAFSFGDELRGHGETNLSLRFDNDGVDIRIVRILEGRNPNAGARRSHLMHVVGELRFIDVLHLFDGHSGLDLGEHEPITVVIVTYVLVVQIRIPPIVIGPLGLVPMVDDHDLPIRIMGGNHEKNQVVEYLLNFGRALSG